MLAATENPTLVPGAGGADVALPVDQWRELTRQGAYLPVWTRLDGDSMCPLIRRNRDAVHIVPLSRPPVRGDIVLFRRADGRYVVHRVWRIREGGLQTFGDHCRRPDPWMPGESICGMAVGLARSGRIYALDSPAARALGRAWLLLHGPRALIRHACKIAARGGKRCFRWMRRK